MTFEQLAHGGGLFRNAHFDEANDAGMRQATHEHQFAEILVLGQKNPSFFAGQRKQRFIGGLRVHVRARQNVVAQPLQQIMQAAGRHAGVEQKLHRPMTATRSYTCSPATAR